ncbi:Pre-mRNA splicing factor PRP21 like protein-domain-containing protein [Lobosporangium transversale]|uniref:Pre-mRNA splicing factor PRP21 like protein-domain-containing protein n=1 Tax=Lobosporangium transversale TaxID=64571 RepID=A0A1Y2GCE2_9FUNG|nr:Pre-mRNA splicing factor PRP21 like protein-domain-containing protein [Lobosporangium transversale]ORZ05703.1 Pre-mRNA splicing factor PRP21 like protein-domain-containing protein [Lobosporangium transversale]|eukprot:XP_021877190.1 Pre-mRNA splicing factor PRP21 like protein-domain-containing protein [Lobosporangium transversale]
MSIVLADRTAAFVAGSELGAIVEERLRQKEKNSTKFSFLNPTDPYHAYYAFKVKEAKSGNATAAAEIQAEVEAKVEEAIKPPPAEPPALEFMTPMPSVSAQDLDVLKLTAQFVARNGRQFMVSLAQREARNYQFDFLRPNHSLFGYFSKLVEQYTKILVPTPDMLEQIDSRSANKYAVQDIVMKRVEYTAYQQELRKKKDEKEDAERQAFLSINWQDFVVVQTIEFTEADDAVELPLPKSLRELETMSLTQKRMMQVLAETESAPDMPQDIEIDDDNDDVDMEDSDDEQEQTSVPASSTQEEVKNVNEVVMTAPQLTAPMKIREDYVPKAFKGRTGAALEEATQTCPRCGEQVKVSEMEEHVRVELLDPRWKEQREQAEAKTKASNMLTDGTDVARNLNLLKAHRSDIFSTEEEKKNAEEERKRQIEKERNVWDGQTSTVAITAQRNAAAAATAGGYNQDGSKAQLESSIGPQFAQPPIQQPPLYRQPGTYNQTFRVQPNVSSSIPIPGMVPPPGMPGIPPPHYGQQPPPGMPGAHNLFPGLLGSIPPGVSSLPAPPASANLPLRPPAAVPGLPHAPGTVPAQTPPSGRHPEEDFPTSDRDSKRLKSEHISSLPSTLAPPASSSNALPTASGPSWITLDIQFADPDEFKPEWNRDKLSSLTVENLVNGTKISVVKDRIFATMGFPVGKQKLILPDGTVTKNQSTLGEYGFRIGQRGELRLAVKK